MSEDRTARRRAGVYRHRARELAQAATHEWRDDVRRHILDQAATYQRAADTLATRHAAQIASDSIDPRGPKPR